MAAQERKLRVRPASDFELVEKRGDIDRWTNIKLLEGEFDFLVALKKHDPENFRLVYEAMWWEKRLGGLTDDERNRLVAEFKARCGKN